jgi:hypothetical protein
MWRCKLNTVSTRFLHWVYLTVVVLTVGAVSYMVGYESYDTEIVTLITNRCPADPTELINRPVTIQYLPRSREHYVVYVNRLHAGWLALALA